MAPFQNSQTAAANQVNLRWLRLFVLMHIAARSAITIGSSTAGSWTWLEYVYVALIVTGVSGLIPRYTRVATWTSVGLLGIQIVGTMPITANHVLLEFLCLGVLGILSESRAEEADLAIQALRGLMIIMLFYSGLQKVIHGYYFDGQFLAYATATEDRFASFFRFCMPSSEFSRLRGLRAAELGMGPYRVQSVLFVAISNGAYLLEIAAAVGIAFRKTRVLATVGAMIVVVAIEMGARELLFGALVINLLLLMLPGQWNRKLFPAFAVAYAYLAVASYDLVPMFRYYH